MQQPVALGDTRVELRLVLGGREIVARHPGGAAAVLEDRGEAGGAADLVAVDEHRPVALGDELVEGRLILLRRHPVTRLPGRSGDLAPDRGVALGAGVVIAADGHEPVPGADPAVELGLIVGAAEAVPGDPRGVLGRHGAAGRGDEQRGAERGERHGASWEGRSSQPARHAGAGHRELLGEVGGCEESP